MSADKLDPAVPPTAEAFMRRLLELRNTKEGLPITTHRANIGRAVVAGKKAFRLTFQPFINELFQKQSMFNESLVSLVQVMYRDLQSLEGGTMAMREGMDRRLSSLEEGLRRLEQKVDALSAKDSR